MVYKGHKFRRAKNIFMVGYLPHEHKYGGHVIFARCIPQNKPIPENAVKTKHFWNSTGEPCFAKVIEYSGYSRTNMMYGSDARIYLALDGQCYIAPKQKVIKNDN